MVPYEGTGKCAAPATAETRRHVRSAGVVECGDGRSRRCSLAGGSQGHIYRIVDGRQILADRSSPAKAGEALVIYCSGLGPVDPAVASGQAAPAQEPLVRTTNEVTVTIGGKNAPVFFSGLTPGLVGLYQVNVIVPDGVDPGDNVPLALSVAGQSGPEARMAVQ